jgi:hypothetical protein
MLLTYSHYIGYILLAIGGLMSIFGIRHVITARASRSWPSTSGMISKSSVLTRTRDKSNVLDYYPEIEYQYLVEAKSYKGDERYAGSGSEIFSSEMGAKQVIENYPVGSPVTVYFNPSRPQSAVLHPGNKSQGMKEVIRGALFMAAGLAAVLYHFLLASQS